MSVTTVLDAILAVFSSVGDWIIDQLSSMTSLFWSSESGLTFLGVLAIAGLSISVAFLIIGIIQRFMHFRG